MAGSKIIIGVHGIGDQIHNATIQSVARIFGKVYEAEGGIPLGRFPLPPEPVTCRYVPPSAPSENQAAASNAKAPAVNTIFFPTCPPDPALQAGIGFKEVYWADIPRSVADTGYVLEESKQWAKTIVDRLRTNYPRQFATREFESIQSVLEEMIDAIAVMEQILFLAGKLGIFKFDLNKLLIDYLDDVQIVADFEKYRTQILKRFTDTLDEVAAYDSNAEIYLVAHSEGTVITFLSLLEALNAKAAPAWLKQVRGLMTIGSPIDKHILLWPELWKGLENTTGAEPTSKITWFNYYDKGDPVGFYLNSARLWLHEHGWEGAFEIPPQQDCGFSRYNLPGKAHVDYWEDKEVFGHFIGKVIDPELLQREPAYGKLKLTKFFPEVTSYLASYLTVFAIFVLAVFALLKGIDQVLDVGGCGCADEDGASTPRNIVGIASLLTGITVAARIPNLTLNWIPRLIAPLVFLLSAVAYFYSVGPQITKSLPTVVVLCLAALVAVIGAVIGLCCHRWGVRVLIIIGGGASIFLMGLAIMGHLGGGSLWPLVPATALFLYLWWLGTLAFDLVFVWHRYVRHSKALDTLHKSFKEKLQARRAAKV